MRERDTKDCQPEDKSWHSGSHFVTTLLKSAPTSKRIKTNTNNHATATTLGHKGLVAMRTPRCVGIFTENVIFAMSAESAEKTEEV